MNKYIQKINIHSQNKEDNNMSNSNIEDKTLSNFDLEDSPTCMPCQRM